MSWLLTALKWGARHWGAVLLAGLALKLMGEGLGLAADLADTRSRLQAEERAHVETRATLALCEATRDAISAQRERDAAACTQSFAAAADACRTAASRARESGAALERLLARPPHAPTPTAGDPPHASFPPVSGTRRLIRADELRDILAPGASPVASD